MSCARQWSLDWEHDFAPLSDIRLNVLFASACFSGSSASSLSINVVGREECFRVVYASLRRGLLYLSNVDGLPSEQKLNLNMRHYALPWWNYRPQEVWEDVHAERCLSAENVKRPPTQESGG